MARGVNKVILIGNLGNDPDTRYLPDGNPVTNISVATTESWKDRQTGETNQRTEWHRIVFFRKLAEIAGEYLKKGSKVYIEGSLRTRNYEKDGQKHYSTEIVANEMQMLDGRSDSGNAGADFNQSSDFSSNASSKASMGSPPGPAPNFESPPPEDFDDDIPF